MKIVINLPIWNILEAKPEFFLCFSKFRLHSHADRKRFFIIENGPDTDSNLSYPSRALRNILFMSLNESLCVSFVFCSTESFIHYSVL